MSRVNAFGQPIGAELSDWRPPTHPRRAPLRGSWCELSPVDLARDGDQLFDALENGSDGRQWTYLAYGPFERKDRFDEWLASITQSSDPMFLTVRDSLTQTAQGLASFLRIDPPSGAIEVGHIHFSKALQRTTAATEAMYLMMRHAFELGYRRYEWKCDALNAPSRTAAERLGFRFEGIFRQATTYKQRNRDTAWYSIIDSEWPSLNNAFQRWLNADNFDQDGQQRLSLSQMIRASRD